MEEQVSFKYSFKKLFLLSLCLQTAVTTFSQEGVAKKFSTEADTTFIKDIIHKASLLQNNFADSSLLLYQHALTKSKLLGFKSGIADCLKGIGRYYSLKNEQEKSNYYLHTALKYCANDVKGHEGVVSIYLMMSNNFYYAGRYDSCAWYRYEALNYLQLYNIQKLKIQLDVYGRLLQFWLNAHQDIRNDPYSRELAMHINSFEKIALAQKDSAALLEIYFQKAGYYNNLNKNDSARYYCDRTLELGKLQNISSSTLMATLLNIGITYVEDKKPDLAIASFNKVIEFPSQQQYVANRFVIFANMMMGEAYVLKKEYKKAISVILPALAQAQVLKIITITDHAHQALADAYEALGQFKEAANQRKLYSVISDSLSKESKLEIMYDLEMKYQIAEKNKAIAQQQLSIAQNESKLKTKDIWIGGITASLILLALLSLLLYRDNLHKEKIQREKIYTMRQDNEINRLKGVISGEEKERSRIAKELHDGMGGTLGSIRGRLSMIYRKHKTADVNNDFLEIMTLLEEASADLRQTSHNLMPEILLHEGLAKAAALFCERMEKAGIMPINFTSFGDAKKMSTEFELSVYRIIQELVQNIVKHAKATEANVQLVFLPTQISLTVEDNGIGIVLNNENNTGGVGLTTIRERINSLKGKLDINSAPGKGTSIYIEFDLA